MPWNRATRSKYNRDHLRYPSDLTDEEYQVIAPFLPPSQGGRPRKWTWRALMEGMLYVLENGITWRALPKDFPPWQTVYGAFRSLRALGILESLCQRLCRVARYAAGVPVEPTIALLDSQTIKTTETGSFKGYNGHKHVTGYKKQVATDEGGRYLHTDLHPANDNDTIGAIPLLAPLIEMFPFLEKLIADEGYRGEFFFNCVHAVHSWRLYTTGTKPLNQQRAMVEANHAWLGRNRRLKRDYERDPYQALAFNQLAAVKNLSRQAVPALKRL
jgi:putative transposase